MVPSTLFSALWQFAIVSQVVASPSFVRDDKATVLQPQKRQAVSNSTYLTEKTASTYLTLTRGCFSIHSLLENETDETHTEFLVNGTNIPHVPLDIGESYAGLLPISDKANDTQQLYFWFFPSDNAAARDEITIWLNGGPGCSSLIGLLTENGKFLLQEGTTMPVLNDWSWTKLTNVVCTSCDDLLEGAFFLCGSQISC